MSGLKSIAVIGGGILGTAIARELTIRRPDAKVTLLEKEAALAMHQTGHNSGVVHAGLYYEPGSLKAKLCRRGSEMIAAYALANEIPFEQCGKVVVALDDTELTRLDSIHQRAQANGVPGIELIGAEQLRELEPNAAGVAALHSPRTGIIDYPRVVECLSDDLRAAGGEILLGAEVTAVSQDERGVTLGTSSDTLRFDAVIAAGGLQSDRIARLADGPPDPAIIPFFGEYLLLEQRFSEVTNGLIYPVPDPRYPFLGVHLTKRVNGQMTIGPNAFLALDRERYRGHGIDPRDAWDVASSVGFWRFASRNTRAAAKELRGVLSRRYLVRSAAQYVPSVADAKVTVLPRGVRAQALSRRGQLVDDFVIDHLGALTLLRNAPSPGATASLAIAEHVVEQMLASLDR